MRAELVTLESRIGHRFSSQELLRRAFTHTSFANEARTGQGSPLDDNEQLEFLGDSVLGFLAAEALVERNPQSPRRRPLAPQGPPGERGPLARRGPAPGPGQLPRSGPQRGDERRPRQEDPAGGRSRSPHRRHLPGWRHGGRARAFVAGHILDAPFAADEDAGTDVQPAITNFKSALQELAQARKLPQPRYAIVGERGPEHAKTFTVEVRAGKEWTGQAEGRTKKVAAQRAARAVYERLAALQPDSAAVEAGALPPSGPGAPPPATPACPAS